ncbi:hypothetical protein [Haloarchaeobius sp. TZWWS8]|uniref:hypothetical protein n=1 Tax=Haloarchaeobius sp. TZWWS8 TaxID=3446121 RepID=UPI003EBDC9C8
MTANTSSEVDDDGGQSTTPGDGQGVPGWRRFRQSVLLGADRRLVWTSLVLAMFLFVFGMGWAGLLGVTKSSAVTPVFSATITGVFTIVSIVLSINQLVLSRVLGSPGELSEKMDGSIEFRESLEDRAGVSAAPTDPGEFTRLIVDTLQDRAGSLDERLSDDGDDVAEQVHEFAEAIEEYADSVEEKLDGRDDETFNVLSAVLMDNYSQNMRQARHLRDAHEDDLSESALSDLKDIRELLRTVGVARQYLKTLYVHQELARLSRRLLYVGVPALAAMSVTVLGYGLSSGPPVSGTRLLLVVAFSLAIGFAPFAVLFAYVLRIATIARLTASIGPFTPKEESPGS